MVVWLKATRNRKSAYLLHSITIGNSTFHNSIELCTLEKVIYMELVPKMIQVFPSLFINLIFCLLGLWVLCSLHYMFLFCSRTFQISLWVNTCFTSVSQMWVEFQHISMYSYISTKLHCYEHSGVLICVHRQTLLIIKWKQTSWSFNRLLLVLL